MFHKGYDSMRSGSWGNWGLGSLGTGGEVKSPSPSLPRAATQAGIMSAEILGVSCRFFSFKTLVVDFK